MVDLAIASNFARDLTEEQFAARPREHQLASRRAEQVAARRQEQVAARRERSVGRRVLARLVQVRG